MKKLIPNFVLIAILVALALAYLVLREPPLKKIVKETVRQPIVILLYLEHGSNSMPAHSDSVNLAKEYCLSEPNYEFVSAYEHRLKSITYVGFKKLDEKRISRIYAINRGVVTPNTYFNPPEDLSETDSFIEKELAEGFQYNKTIDRNGERPLK